MAETTTSALECGFMTLLASEAGAAVKQEGKPALKNETCKPARGWLTLFVSASFLLASCGGDSTSGTMSPLAVASLASPGISLLAGQPGGSGNADDTGSDARFGQPSGIARDSSGNLYVTDAANHTVRKISPAGVVSTLAGTSGQAGTADATGTAASFNTPIGIAVDSSTGTVYVADTFNSVIRKITAAGAVTTLAGTAGETGAVDDTGAAARFNSPLGIAVDEATGTVYVADSSNQTIRKITPAGVVTTIAGLAGSPGTVNQPGTQARFVLPAGLALASDGTLYVADAGANVIRVIDPAGNTSTLAGSAGAAGYNDGVGTAATFTSPIGITLGGDGALYVAEAGSHLLRKVQLSDGTVSTLAGTRGSAGAVDGTGTAASFNSLAGIVADGAGKLYVADSLNYAIRQVTTAGVVTTLVGAPSATGTANDTGTLARFSTPSGIGVGNDGSVYVADTNNHSIRQISPAGAVTTLAGLSGTAGSSTGSGSAARFYGPDGLVADADGSLYVADTNNHVIRKVSADGQVNVLAGLAGSSGTADGGGQARFNHPHGVAIDLAGNVYVADTGNHTIRKIGTNGQVTTLAGTAGSSGAHDDVGTAASFNSPNGIAVGRDGTVYVADTNNHVIRAISAAGVVTTMAGSGVAGADDALGTAASFRSPSAVVVDADGNLYVADTGNGLIRQISPTGQVATVAGTAGLHGVLPGGLPGRLNSPRGLAIGMDGELYVSDENTVLKIVLPTPAKLFGVKLTASSTSISLGQPTTLRWSAPDATNCTATADPVSASWSGSQAAGGSLVVTPAAVGTQTYTLTCDESGGSGQQFSSVDIVVVYPVPTVTISASPKTLTPGGSTILTWSSSNADTCTASGDWSGSKGTSDSESVTPAEGVRTYTLSCTGQGGTGSKSVSVSVGYPPTMTLTASRTTLTLGQSLVLNWSSSHTDSCTASGAWSGSKLSTGSESVTPEATGEQVYGLNCVGPGGSTIRAVSVTVNPVASGDGSSGGGGSGGAAGLEILSGLGLIAFLRRFRDGQYRRA